MTVRPEIAELPKTYDPKAVEPRLYEWWERSGFFHEDPDPARPPFIIPMPPPNVTGRAHLGHGSTYTPMDVLTRYHRMLGDNADWLPGLDHAAIATEAVLVRGISQGRRRSRPARTRSFRGAGVGVVAHVRRHDQRSISQARLRARLGARALHDGRWALGGRSQGVRRALPRGADLSRQALDQLGSEGEDDRFGCGSRPRRTRLVSVASDAIRRRTGRSRSKSPRRGRKRCSATLRSPCIPKTNATPRLIGKTRAIAAAACSAKFRSSPTPPSNAISERAR